jgi:hypothetical protein
MISEVWDGVNLNLTFRTVVSAQITRDRPRFRLSAVTARTVRVRACAETVRGENGRKRSVNTKTIFIFIFFSETRSKTVTPETKTTSVIRKHQKRKFGTKIRSVTIEI